MCNDTVYSNYIFNAYMLIAARVALATLYSFGHIWFSTFNYLRLWYSGTCKIPQSCRHFSCPYALSFFSAFQKRKGCITPFSKHYGKWCRMDLSSVMKCSSPAQRAVAKAYAKRPKSSELFYLSTATNSTQKIRSIS